MEPIGNSLSLGDCIHGMEDLPAGSVDLVFADPPFNIGYDYDVYNDSLEYRQYLEWSSRWISAVHRVLKSNGTFWLAIGDEFAAELKLESQKLGFHCRSWVIWYYTFGVHCSKKFTRSHAHLFHFVNDPKDFTFRDHDVRVPSARELVYKDKRANPAGRMPDDTWIIRPADCVGEMISDDEENWSPHVSDEDRTFVLRPQDVSGGFQASQDTWYFPRVAGTFKERTGFHGCQMPEQLLGRIIRACSNPDDVVLDPFSGSATTLAVAKKLGRRFIGFEISDDYVAFGRERLKEIRVGDPLDGSPEPLKSAPKTTRDNGRSKSSSDKKQRGSKTPASQRRLNDEQREDLFHRELTARGVIGAFARTHDGYSADRVVSDPQLNRQFLTECEEMGLVGDARTWNMLLFRLRKTGKLLQIPTTRRTTIPWEHCDRYMFASEIAIQQMLDDGVAQSLDDILCDPSVADEFDRKAKRLAPGFEPLEYRWAALRLRKEAKKARRRARRLKPPRQFEDSVSITEIDRENLAESPGLYVVGDGNGKFYVGETLNLQSRFSLQFAADQLETWSEFSGQMQVETLVMENSQAGRLAWQSCLLKSCEFRPKLNYFELRSMT